MRVKHFSDIHSDLTILGGIPLSEGFDAWINTGDLFPNRTRGNRKIEPAFQEDWFLGKRAPFLRDLVASLLLLWTATMISFRLVRC